MYVYVVYFVMYDSVLFLLLSYGHHDWLNKVLLFLFLFLFFTLVSIFFDNSNVLFIYFFCKICSGVNIFSAHRHFYVNLIFGKLFFLAILFCVIFVGFFLTIFVCVHLP